MKNRLGCLARLFLKPTFSALFLLLPIIQSTPSQADLVGDGLLDGGFTIINSDFEANKPEEIHAMVLQNDGKIVVGGVRHNGSNKVFFVARYCPNGFIDNEANNKIIDNKSNCPPSETSGFGTNKTGSVEVDANGEDSQINAMGLQSSGKIVLAGSTLVHHAADHFVFAVARLCIDGSLDDGFSNPQVCGGEGFGVSGKMLINVSGDNHLDNEGKAVSILSDDRILIAGYTKVMSLDENFANKISSTNIALVQLCPDGSFDDSVSKCSSTGFGDPDNVNKLTGIAVVDLSKLVGQPNKDSTAEALALDPQTGKILVGGSAIANNEGIRSAAVSRFCPNGLLDNVTNCGAPGFGPAGKGVSIQSPNNSPTQVSGITIQPDNKIIILGSFLVSNGQGSNNFHSFITRLCPDGQLLDKENNCGEGFGNGLSGTVISNLFDSEYPRAISIQADGKIVIGETSFTEATSEINFALLRFCPNGALDDGNETHCGKPGFGTDGKGILQKDFNNKSFDYLTSLKIQPLDGKIIAGGFIDLKSGDKNFALARFYGIVSDLQVTQTTSGNAKPDTSLINKPITHTITVTNKGPDTAMNVILNTNLIPTTSTFTEGAFGSNKCSVVENDPKRKKGGKTGPATHYQNCNLGNLKSGEEVKVVFTVTPTASGEDLAFAPTLTMTGSFDPDTKNNAPTLSLKIVDSIPAQEAPGTDPGTKQPTGTDTGANPGGAQPAVDNSGGGGGCAMTGAVTPSPSVAGLVSLVFLAALYRTLRRKAKMEA